MRKSCPGCPIYRELPPINEAFAAGPSRDGLHPGGAPSLGFKDFSKSCGWNHRNGRKSSLAKVISLYSQAPCLRTFCYRLDCRDCFGSAKAVV